MAGKISHYFRNHNAEQFYEMFGEAEETNLYFFISKATPWTNESSPETPLDSSEVIDYKIWNEMLALKKITPANVSFGAKRNQWTTGTVYAQYDSSTELDDNFYVVTDEYQVYKCLYNNNGATSTVKPQSKALTTFTTADGYIWKYMYSITVSDALNFLLNSYMPVKTLLTDDLSDQWDVQQAADFGTIDVIKVVSGGNNYISTTNNFVVTGNSSSATLAASASAVDSIYNGMDMYITAGPGVGQLTSITAYDGTTKVVTLSPVLSVVPTSASTYLISPKVTITGNGTGATAYSKVANAAISEIVVLTTGADYTSANVAITAGGGTGATANVVFSPINGHGSDPVRELHGHNVIMSIQLTSSDSNFMTSNDYRTIGIISDPKLANNSIADNLVYDQTYRLTLSSETGNFLGDEVITGGTSGATGILVTHSNNSASVLGTNSIAFANSEVITGTTSAVTATITSVSTPDLSKFTGKILYFENRAPITRSEDQRENVRFVVKF